jgi:hypothetical protein
MVGSKDENDDVEFFAGTDIQAPNEQRAMEIAVREEWDDDLKDLQPVAKIVGIRQ